VIVPLALLQFVFTCWDPAMASPKVRVDSGDLVLEAGGAGAAGGGVLVRKAGQSDFALESLPAMSASIDATTAGLQTSIANSIQGLRSDITSAVGSVAAQQGAATASLATTLNAVPSQVTAQLNPTISRLTQQVNTLQADRTVQTVASTQRRISQTVAASSSQIASLQNMTARQEVAIAAAARCAFNGGNYNTTSRECVGGAELLGEPDYQSDWFMMQSQTGSWAFTFKELRHNLNVDPEVVKVVAMYTGGGAMRGHVIEGIGASICDDDGNNGCNEYGGFIYAYDNTRIRIWIPEQSNGPRYGHTFMINDGWGGGMYNIQTDGRLTQPVMFRAYVWRKYRQGANADFDTTVTMTSNNRANSYLLRPHQLNAYPERVMVTVQATGGPNNGFKFPARGNAMADDDGRKDYGGLVYAYNNQNVRLWAASGPGGRIVHVNDGWGGERYSYTSSSARVRVRAWRARTPPAFTSDWYQMCANCAPWTTGNPSTCNNINRDMSFKRVEHGLGRLPARVVVQLRARAGPNNGYIFEAVGAANDDEHDDRAGSTFTYDDRYVHVYAPTRSNGRTDGRFLGVQDGWGHGQFNTNERCGYMRVMAWGR